MKAVGNQLWVAVVDSFGELRGPQARDLWLSDVQPASLQRGMLLLEVPNASVKVAIDARYRTDLESILHEITGSPVSVRTEVRACGLDRAERVRALPPGPLLAPAPAETPDTGPFVVVESNRLAHLAADRFCLSDERDFSPLFVHGPEGCGKTLLAGWVLARLRQLGDVRRPLVLGAEAMSRDVVRAYRRREVAPLRRAWAERDLLVIDEIHRLRGRRRTQEEAAGLIGRALEGGTRVLLLSRHAPREIPLFSDRLQSQMAAGMVVAMGDPTPSERLEILSRLARRLPVRVDADVLTTLARRHPGPLSVVVDRLGVLAKDALAEGVVLDGRRLDGRLKATHRAALRVDEIVDLVAEHLGVAPGRVRSSEKTRSVAIARHLCIDLATRSLGLSARQVCRHLGLNSPSTVPYARERVARRRGNDPDFDRLVLRLQAEIEGAQRELPWS